MHDLNCADPDAMHYEPLARVTRFHKTSDEGVRKMSGVFEAFRKEIEGEIGEQYLARGISIGAGLTANAEATNAARITALP
jgi:hypothetical protein